MKKSIRSSALNFGIKLGIVLALSTIIGYSIYHDLFTNLWIGALLLITTVIFGIVSSIKSRKLLGGYIDFKTAFTSYLTTIAIGTLINTLVSIFIFVVIDQEMAQIINQKIIDSSVSLLENFGAPESEIEKTVAEMKKENQFSLTSHIKGWFWKILLYIIIGLFSCLAIKKREPLY